MSDIEPTPENSTLPETPEQGELSRGEQFSVDLDRINDAIIAMLTDPTTDAAALEEAWLLRAALAEEFVDSLEPTPNNPDPRARVQFDIMVDTALIFEKLGNTSRYLSELATAEGFALNHHLDDVAVSIGEEIDSKTEELDDSAEALVVRLRPYVGFKNREYLRDLIQEGTDTEDLIGAIYGMILDEGGDPDEVLAALGVTQD